MILNSTNCKQITKLAGTPYIEKWSGTKIQVGVEKVKAFGDVVEALRVRKFAPKAVSIKCESCGENITAANSMSVDQLAKYTAKKYGAKLCAACATKAASGKAEPKPEPEQANETNKK